jgi:peptidoglycan/LPS O-acetylase OafA/YrhL
MTAFVALTAIGGGIAMLTGADRFPLEWLRGTPFADYTIPALVLIFVVGGSSLLAALLIFTKRELGTHIAVAAGLLLVGYIGVEVLILKQSPPGPTWIEILYFVLGALVAGMGAFLWQHEPPRQTRAM